MSPLASTPHRIRRRTLELCVTNEAAAAKWQSLARELWEEALGPGLEEALDHCGAQQDKIWRLPRVEVELRINSDTPWTEIRDTFIALLRERLADQLKGGSIKPLSRRGPGNSPAVEQSTQIEPVRHAEEWLTFWLRHGTLPWWAGQPTARVAAETLLEILRSSIGKSVANRLASLLRAHPAAAQRLAVHLPRDLRSELFLAAGGTDSSATIARLDGWLCTGLEPNNSSELVPIIWEATWLAWARQGRLPMGWPEDVRRLAHDAGSVSPETLRLIFLTHIGHQAGMAPESAAVKSHRQHISPIPTAHRETLNNPDREHSDLGSCEGESPSGEQASPTERSLFAVGNAGLVLVSPYLNGFFAALGYDQFLRRSSNADRPDPFPPEIGRLVLVLHYLATGATSAFEPELILPKLLCGVPPEWPVPADFEPTEREQAEVTALLDGIIKNWPALGATSVEGLRSAFLARPGWLESLDSGWKLSVEGRGWDVLVERVPWTFRTVKLSWMPQTLWVEWNAAK